MKLTLVRGDEKAELEGDDNQIENSVMYNYTFRDKASELMIRFYTKTHDQEAT